MQDRVTTLGSGVDGNVRGLLARVSSYSDATVGSGTVRNEIERTYDDFGHLTTEYQDHDSAVSTSTSPKVQYTYSTGSAGHARLTKMTYPNGRVLHVGYDSGTDDNINRVSWLADDNDESVGTHLVEYEYLGLGFVVEADYTEPDLRFDLDHGTAGTYAGLDAFGRVDDMLWRDYGSSTDAVRIQHGYDRAGNRLWRQDPVADSNSRDFDELYDYDGMYQLASLDRGDLNGTQTGLVSATKTFAEAFTLDPTGNWTEFKKDTDGNGSWNLDQDRAHTEANEVDTIDAASTHVLHDRAGNMTRLPKPSSWSTHFHAKYDAWNRLVEVEDSDDTTNIATYAYDGENRRIRKDLYEASSSSSSSSTGDTNERHFYHSRQWQVIEEKLAGAGEPNRQYVWGLRFVDDLVLRDMNTTSGGHLGKANSGLDQRLYAMQGPNFKRVTPVLEPAHYTQIGTIRAARHHSQ